MESRHAISDLLSPSDARRRTSSAWSEALRGRPCWHPSCRACSIPARTRSLRIFAYDWADALMEERAKRKKERGK